MDDVPQQLFLHIPDDCELLHIKLTAELSYLMGGLGRVNRPAYFWSSGSLCTRVQQELRGCGEFSRWQPGQVWTAWPNRGLFQREGIKWQHPLCEHMSASFRTESVSCSTHRSEKRALEFKRFEIDCRCFELSGHMWLKSMTLWKGLLVIFLRT